jgi:hypothetical protein
MSLCADAVNVLRSVSPRSMTAAQIAEKLGQTDASQVGSVLYKLYINPKNTTIDRARTGEERGSYRPLFRYWYKENAALYQRAAS